MKDIYFKDLPEDTQQKMLEFFEEENIKFTELGNKSFKAKIKLKNSQETDARILFSKLSNKKSSSSYKTGKRQKFGITPKRVTGGNRNTQNEQYGRMSSKQLIELAKSDPDQKLEIIRFLEERLSPHKNTSDTFNLTSNTQIQKGTTSRSRLHSFNQDSNNISSRNKNNILRIPLKNLSRIETKNFSIHDINNPNHTSSDRYARLFLNNKSQDDLKPETAKQNNKKNVPFKPSRINRDHDISFYFEEGDNGLLKSDPSEQGRYYVDRRSPDEETEVNVEIQNSMQIEKPERTNTLDSMISKNISRSPPQKQRKGCDSKILNSSTRRWYISPNKESQVKPKKWIPSLIHRTPSTFKQQQKQQSQIHSIQRQGFNSSNIQISQRGQDFQKKRQRPESNNSRKVSPFKPNKKSQSSKKYKPRNKHGKEEQEDEEEEEMTDEKLKKMRRLGIPYHVDKTRSERKKKRILEQQNENMNSDQKAGTRNGKVDRSSRLEKRSKSNLSNSNFGPSNMQNLDTDSLLNYYKHVVNKGRREYIVDQRKKADERRKAGPYYELLY